MKPPMYVNGQSCKWRLPNFMARNATWWTLLAKVRAWYILAYYYWVGFIAVSLVSVICSECNFPFPQRTCTPDPIHAGIFILRTYVLWNQNRIVLTVMLFSFFVSHLPLYTRTPHVHDFMHESGHHHIVRQRSLCHHYPCTVYAFSPYHWRPTHALRVHSWDQRDPGYHRVLPGRVH